MALEQMMTSWDYAQGRCALFDGETTCGLPRGHQREPGGVRWHRFHDPSGSSRWIDKDDDGVEQGRGPLHDGAWMSESPLRRREHEFRAADDRPPVEARDVGRCCGLVRGAFVHHAAELAAGRDWQQAARRACPRCSSDTCPGRDDVGRCTALILDAEQTPAAWAARETVVEGQEGFDDGFDVCPERSCSLFGRAVMADHQHLAVKVTLCSCAAVHTGPCSTAPPRLMPSARSRPPTCGDTAWAALFSGAPRLCALEAGHLGMHRADDGMEWQHGRPRADRGPQLAPPLAGGPMPTRLRVGRSVGRTLYDADNDRLIGLVDTPELAEELARRWNGVAAIAAVARLEEGDRG